MRPGAWWKLPLHLLSLLGLAGSPSALYAQVKADIIIHHAFVWSGDTLEAPYEAIAIKGKQILALGTNEEILLKKGRKTKVIDAQGNFLMPGIIEAHGHFTALGNSLLELNLLKAPSWQWIEEQVAAGVKHANDGEWLVGRGWHQEKWNLPTNPSVEGYPTHTRLSALSPRNPVLLSHASGHSLFANALAMKMAGVNKDTPDPEGGRIIRDDQGNPTGVFEENAMELIEQAWRTSKLRTSPETRERLWLKSILAATQHCWANGVTSFQDAGTSLEEIRQFRELAGKKKLGVRIWSKMAQMNPYDFARATARGYPIIEPSGFYRCQALKCYADGALGSYGALLLAPYQDRPDLIGQLVTPIDSLKALARICKEKKLQLCIHAIGDKANRLVLDIYQETWKMELDDLAQHRWRIEHAQHLDPLDIPRFSKLGVIASMQAIHCTSDAPYVEKRLGAKRAVEGAYVWRSLIESGARMANGTDTPVEALDPMANLYAAVTRTRTDGTQFTFYTPQRLSRQEGLLSLTDWNAYAAFEENEKGKLRPGMLADLILVDQNLLKCAPEKIISAKIRMTMVNGRVVYQH